MPKVIAAFAKSLARAAGFTIQTDGTVRSGETIVYRCSIETGDHVDAEEFYTLLEWITRRQPRRLTLVEAYAGTLQVDDLGILANADRFAQGELYPLASRMDDEEWWPAEAFPKIGATGYFGITAPEALGGSGLDVFTSGLILQAFGRWNHALALAWVAHENLCLHNILRNANREQQEKYVPGLCKGTQIGALGLTEPGAGSDALGSMRTTARREGGHYILNGRKLYITNGPVADVLLVYAKTDRDKGAQGISAFIVEKDFAGFKVAQKLTKMGFRGSQTAELVFDDCRVPVENRVETVG